MTSAQALAALIRENHDELLTLWRKKVRQLPNAKNLDRPNLHDHITIFLRELVLALENGTCQSIAENISMA